MSIREYLEDGLCINPSAEAAHTKTFDRMTNAFAKTNMNPFRDFSSIAGNEAYMKMLTEAACIPMTAVGTNRYQIEDLNNLKALYENVSHSIMNEAVQSISSISPIMLNSFGIQERALISAHLNRAVKNIVAKVDNFKLTERIPYIVDLAGVRTKFIDAFTPNEDGSMNNIALSDSVTMSFANGSTDVSLYQGSTAGIGVEDDGYRPAVDAGQVFDHNSSLQSVVIVPTEDYTVDENSIKFGPKSQRSPNVEDGSFRTQISWTEKKDSVADVKVSAWINGTFDFSNGKLVNISSTSNKITYVSFKMVLSPETHTKAVTVGYETFHTPVNIPIGTHFEFQVSEEFKEAADKYYSADAMALLTDYMGKAVEQSKDINIYNVYKGLAEKAVIKTTFNCTPTTAYASGKEEYIRHEFHPFIEKVCISLKNKVRIPNCHFRVLGNPMDIRVAASAGVEYIYRRNEQFAGDITLDYEFSVTSDVHRIFYISSERVPVGKVMVFLIPNSIEDNISTINHYEYSTYVSNKYRAANGSNMPTVMIATRYLTKEYYPVMAEIDIVNNLADGESSVVTGADLKTSFYKKVSYALS